MKTIGKKCAKHKLLLVWDNIFLERSFNQMGSSVKAPIELVMVLDSCCLFLFTGTWRLGLEEEEPAGFVPPGA